MTAFQRDFTTGNPETLDLGSQVQDVAVGNEKSGFFSRFQREGEQSTWHFAFNCLDEFKGVRKEAKFSKEYLQRQFGGIPWWGGFEEVVHHFQ